MRNLALALERPYEDLRRWAAPAEVADVYRDAALEEEQAIHGLAMALRQTPLKLTWLYEVFCTAGGTRDFCLTELLLVLWQDSHESLGKDQLALHRADVDNKGFCLRLLARR